MTTLLAYFSLAVMVPIAVISLAFASSKPTVVIWNFAWYWFMGSVAQIATRSPYGHLLGIVFAIFYCSRLLRKPTRPKSQVAFQNFEGLGDLGRILQQMARAQRQASGKPDLDDGDDDLGPSAVSRRASTDPIDAEFKKVGAVPLEDKRDKPSE